MNDVRRYLSDRLLSEELPVTYRLLSRALNLHVNQAKGALYEFYQYQNGLRAKSVFATYMVSGIKSQEIESSIRSSSSDEAPEDASPIVTLTLVAEETIRDVLAEFERVDSIHVYSLAPHAQKDLTLLSEAARAVSEYSARDEAVNAEERKKYGVILNPDARKRDRKGAPVPVSSSTARPAAPRPPKTEAAPASPPAKSTIFSKAPQAAKLKQEATPTSSQLAPASSGAGQKPVASSKRGQGGGIMSSFAKAAAKPSSAVKKEGSRKKEDEDTAMALSDDGEADDLDLPGEASKKASAEDAAQFKSRKQREEDLRRMMEESDDDDAARREDAVEEGNEDEDEEMGDAEEVEPEPEPEPELVAEEKPSEIVSASGQGRRRGKRRVMKKKRILDDQGYMEAVTIQEEGWESFSEDEAPPLAPKPAPAVSAPKAPKAKKPAKGGAGQGSIMSFFTKK